MSGDGRLASGWQHGGRQETQAGDARPEVRPEATRGHESCANRRPQKNPEKQGAEGEETGKETEVNVRKIQETGQVLMSAS